MKLLLIIFSLFSLNTFAFEECQNLLSDCEYYTCINKIKKCGKRSYFESFGRKYCHKFAKWEHKFSSQGKNWIEDTKTCLITSIDELEEGLNCKQFKRAAVSQHVPCYINSGYCELSNKDKARVTATVIATMWRPDLIKAAMQVLSSCRKK